jgi:hypothetical protein
VGSWPFILTEHDYRVNQRAFEHLIWQNDQLIQLLEATQSAPDFLASSFGSRFNIVVNRAGC